HPTLLATLKVDRPRQLFAAVESTSRDAGDLLAIDDGFTVLHNGNGSPDKGDIEALPFSGLARKLRRGGKESVHPARMVTGWFLRGVRFYLHLIAAPQIHATIGLGAAVKLQLQFEILKIGSGDDLSTLSVA